MVQVILKLHPARRRHLCPCPERIVGINGVVVRLGKDSRLDLRKYAVLDVLAGPEESRQYKVAYIGR